ncbi:MAG: acetate--CoA ligase family protein, partial [Acidobacteriia bacterium]|nr:acetate--CoA ligase family protein [Terriglobia bacterium]
MVVETGTIEALLRSARDRGAFALLEVEGLAILRELGIPTPFHRFVQNAAEAAVLDIEEFTGDWVVIKVVSPLILHKSDVGALATVRRSRRDIAAAIENLAVKFVDAELEGFTIHQFVPYSPALGNELLLGARWTEEFGPVVTLGPGGIYTEFLTKNFKPGKDIAVFSPALIPSGRLSEILSQPAVTELITGTLRGQRSRIRKRQIAEVVERFADFARGTMPDWISECEINPLVISDGELVALDILVKLSVPKKRREFDRPIEKIQNLLQPHSVAVMGVSEKMNAGHIILNNLIREGFDRDRIFVVKPGIDTLEKCVCVPSIEALPYRVDLFILSIEATQAPLAITEIIEHRKAESIILIPGGLEEKSGTEGLVRSMRTALENSRDTEWHGPVINGGNCLGVISRPGHYDTMFIPEYKLPVSRQAVSPLAILSQSGALAVAKASKLALLNPTYSITVGNQMDLTLGDYLMFLKDDPSLEIFAVYVEGFRPGDGLRFLRAAEEITSSGRTVILYRAGRTAAGAQAAASHTASLAGDYTVTRQLAQQAGIVVAETLADFEDLIKLAVLLRPKDFHGWRLGAVSNAGFECVSIADCLGDFRFTPFGSQTLDRLESIFKRAHIDRLVDLHNPIDLTPMANDEAFAETVRAVLEDPGVDAVIAGCVPLTSML